MRKKSDAACLARRSAVCLFILFAMLLFCGLRVAVISASEDYAAVQERQSRLRLTVTRPRGTIYDRNMLPLTNQREKTVAAVSPVPRAVTAIRRELRGQETLSGVLSGLAAGKPVLCEVGGEISCDGITCFSVAENDPASTTAQHILGYTDAEGHGVSGLEYAYDSLLYCDQTVDVLYTADGRGKVLEGIPPEVCGSTAGGNCLVTTLDINIQKTVEASADGIERGAVVLCDAANGKLRAVCSLPGFDRTQVVGLLDRDDAPLMNRALSAYNVGSVFKPCVAAAGLECGEGNFTVTCTGKNEIGSRVFRCHKLTGHGTVGLRDALAFSCNSFFYRYALRLGGNAVYRMASSLGFGTGIAIADGVASAQGKLPAAAALGDEETLANFSIGQGELLLTPVSLLTLYCAIASDGTYRLPSLIEATVRDGKRRDIVAAAPTRVMSETTASWLREALTAVITDGTGTAAKPTLCTAAGKTATAQTGRYRADGTEITYSWFCGFFPAEQPKYAAVIFVEQGEPGAAAKTFARIADALCSAGEMQKSG